MKLLQGTEMTQRIECADLELAMSNDLRVPKREVLAEVSFSFSPKPLQGCLFYLSYYSPQLHGEESLPEHLNSGRSFFPLRKQGCHDFFIVHVDQILFVREAAGIESNLGPRFQLLMDKGPVLRVSMPEQRPVWMSRPIDRLNNDTERFITFVQDVHSRLHINKSHIARVGGL